MEHTPSLREVVERDLRMAFAGVTLGRGTSLRQAVVIDNYGKGVSDSEFEMLPQKEVTDAWDQVPFSELESDNVAHLDLEGYRYYLPAFLISVLDNYNPLSMRVIGTLGCLYPKDLMNEYHLPRYNFLSLEQRVAVAQYLEALPRLVPLDDDDLELVQKAQEKYWGQFRKASHDI